MSIFRNKKCVKITKEQIKDMTGNLTIYGKGFLGREKIIETVDITNVYDDMEIKLKPGNYEFTIGSNPNKIPFVVTKDDSTILPIGKAHTKNPTIVAPGPHDLPRSPFPQSGTPSWRVSCFLDISGSMGEEVNGVPKIKKAKESLINALTLIKERQALSKEDVIRFYVFPMQNPDGSHDNYDFKKYEDVKFSECWDKNGKFSHQILELPCMKDGNNYKEPKGMTPLWYTLSKAFTHIVSDGTKDFIFILTDGDDNSSQKPLLGKEDTILKNIRVNYSKECKELVLQILQLKIDQGNAKPFEDFFFIYTVSNEERERKVLKKFAEEVDKKGFQLTYGEKEDNVEEAIRKAFENLTNIVVINQILRLSGNTKKLRPIITRLPLERNLREELKNYYENFQDNNDDYHKFCALYLNSATRILDSVDDVDIDSEVKKILKIISGIYGISEEGISLEDMKQKDYTIQDSLSKLQLLIDDNNVEEEYKKDLTLFSYMTKTLIMEVE